MLSLYLQLLNEGRHSDSRIRSFACTAGAQKTIAHLCKVKAKAINLAPPYFEHRTDNDIHQMPRELLFSSSQNIPFLQNKKYTFLPLSEGGARASVSGQTKSTFSGVSRGGRGLTRSRWRCRCCERRGRCCAGRSCLRLRRV